MKRIVITGAECTGKSTLAQALSGYYGEPWTAEFVRNYVDETDRELGVEDLEPIARGQLALEDESLSKATRFVIHDTNLLSSIIYANHYYNKVIDWVNDAFLGREYHLYLFCQPDIPWKADPKQRESAEERARLHDVFKASIKRLELPYVEIAGEELKRFGLAVSAIDKLLED
ncbi:MAG: ATP-binding protein [Verrucomicrobiota bacterium]